MRFAAGHWLATPATGSNASKTSPQPARPGCGSGSAGVVSSARSITCAFLASRFYRISREPDSMAVVSLAREGTDDGDPSGLERYLGRRVLATPGLKPS